MISETPVTVNRPVYRYLTPPTLNSQGKVIVGKLHIKLIGLAVMYANLNLNRIMSVTK